MIMVPRLGLRPQMPHPGLEHRIRIGIFAHFVGLHPQDFTAEGHLPPARKGLWIHEPRKAGDEAAENGAFFLRTPVFAESAGEHQQIAVIGQVTDLDHLPAPSHLAPFPGLGRLLDLVQLDGLGRRFADLPGQLTGAPGQPQHQAGDKMAPFHLANILQMALPCWIYASPRKDEMYLYLAREDDFDCVPVELLERFGPPRLVMTLELHGDRRLARADVEEVMTRLRDRGYYLQMPPRLVPEIYHGNQD